MILATLLAFGAASVLALIVYNLAVHALPFAVGVAAASAAHASGAGLFGAALAGVVAGAFTFAVGQTLFTQMRSPLLRLLVATVFAGPAALAGYAISYRLLSLGVPSEIWRTIFATAGALAIGAVACLRLVQGDPARAVEPGVRT